MEYFLREYAERSIRPYLRTSRSTVQTYMRYALQTAAMANAENKNVSHSLLAAEQDPYNGETNSDDYYLITSASVAEQLFNDSDTAILTSAELLQPEFAYNESGNAAIGSASLLALSTLTMTMKNIGNFANTTTTAAAAAAAAAVTTTAASLVESASEFAEANGFDDFDIPGIICDDSAQNGTEEVSALSTVYFKTAVYLMYIPIFVFALMGNGTVCYIVQSTPRMRTVTNYFIANLAVGDILMSLFCVPFSFVSIFILNHWPFGTVLCNLVNYSQAVSVLVSAYTLVAISIDRYIAIMWPLRPRITKRLAKFIIAGVWFIALATALPILIVSKLSQPESWFVECQRYICREEWPSNEQNYYYTLVLLILQFLVPLSVLIFTYTRIACAVWGKRPPGEAENSRDQRMARSKRKNVCQRHQARSLDESSSLRQ